MALGRGAAQGLAARGAARAQPQRSRALRDEVRGHGATALAGDAALQDADGLGGADLSDNRAVGRRGDRPVGAVQHDGEVGTGFHGDGVAVVGLAEGRGRARRAGTDREERARGRHGQAGDHSEQASPRSRLSDRSRARSWCLVRHVLLASRRRGGPARAGTGGPDPEGAVIFSSCHESLETYRPLRPPQRPFAPESAAR